MLKVLFKYLLPLQVLLISGMNQMQASPARLRVVSETALTQAHDVSYIGDSCKDITFRLGHKQSGKTSTERFKIVIEENRDDILKSLRSAKSFVPGSFTPLHDITLTLPQLPVFTGSLCFREFLGSTSCPRYILLRTLRI